MTPCRKYAHLQRKTPTPTITGIYPLSKTLPTDIPFEEIVKALSDINAFNAGKKRDRALELLSAWLPDVEKFSREISKQSEYIDSLKAQIGQEADYAERMRDGKYAEELKVREANIRALR